MAQNMAQKTSEQELLFAIKDLLKSSGHLNKLQAEIRAKVTEALQAREDMNSGDSRPTPKPTDDILLVNELVREYLEWNGYLYTATVMSSEASLPIDKCTREYLCSHVGVRDDDRSSSLPLLSNIIAAYTERIKRKMVKGRK